MNDIKTASMIELAYEMRNRCDAQKETFAVVWGSPEDQMMNYTYTGSLGMLIGNLTHICDYFRRRMLKLGDKINSDEDESEDS